MVNDRLDEVSPLETLARLGIAYELLDSSFDRLRALNAETGRIALLTNEERARIFDTLVQIDRASALHLGQLIDLFAPIGEDDDSSEDDPVDAEEAELALALDASPEKVGVVAVRGEEDAVITKVVASAVIAPVVSVDPSVRHPAERSIPVVITPANNPQNDLPHKIAEHQVEPGHEEFDRRLREFIVSKAGRGQAEGTLDLKVGTIAFGLYGEKLTGDMFRAFCQALNKHPLFVARMEGLYTFSVPKLEKPVAGLPKPEFRVSESQLYAYRVRLVGENSGNTTGCVDIELSQLERALRIPDRGTDIRQVLGTLKWVEAVSDTTYRIYLRDDTSSRSSSSQKGKEPKPKPEQTTVVALGIEEIVEYLPLLIMREVARLCMNERGQKVGELVDALVECGALTSESAAGFRGTSFTVVKGQIAEKLHEAGISVEWVTYDNTRAMRHRLVCKRKVAPSDKGHVSPGIEASTAAKKEVAKDNSNADGANADLGNLVDRALGVTSGYVGQQTKKSEILKAICQGLGCEQDDARALLAEMNNRGITKETRANGSPFVTFL